jgi:hypothetical protein
VGDENRGEYITGFSERKQLLESLLLFLAKIPLDKGPKSFLPTSQRRIDEFF